MSTENFKSTTSNFKMPLPGENVVMICKNFGWKGNAIKPGFGVKGISAEPKCPQCGKKTLEEDPFVMY